MSMKDVIKSSVYESFGGGTGLHFGEICMIILVACAIGAYIFCVYKSFTKRAFYSKDINITIAGICITVAAIMIAMQANLLVSLGMVGALSIVRFRTAVKNPLDLLYLFWSISAGIICGVGLQTLAIGLCIVMTLAIWALGNIPISRAPVLLMIKSEQDIDYEKMEKTIEENSEYHHLSSMMTRSDEIEYIYEVQAKDQSRLVMNLNKLKSIKTVSCLESDAEIRG